MRYSLSETVREFETSRLIPALSAGSTSGLGLLVGHIAYASFVFSGPLLPWSSQGIGLILFGAFAGCLVLALAGGFRGAIAGLSPALVIVMADIGSTIDAEGRTLFATAMAALVIGVVCAAALCSLIGNLRLANLVRFIPYPVASGFVAGIGGAVLLGAIESTGVELGWRTIAEVFDPSVFSIWAPGALYGLALYLAMRRWRNPLILPLSVVLAVSACHAVFAGLGMSGDEARAAGLLLTSTADGTLWPPVGPADIALVDWTELPGQIPNLLVLVLVALICVVMSLAGLEVALNEELDWDREFRATGIASAFSGIGGGTFVSMIVPASFRSKLFGASTRLTGITCALVIGAGLFLGDSLLEFIPAALVAGMLFFAGAGMIEEGLLRSRKRLPTPEYAIVALIFVVIVVFGLIEGVVTGLLAALVFFVLRLSRVDPIAGRFSGRGHRSNKVRPPPDRAILLESGERIHGYRLRGYLFFGSAWPLVANLKRSLEDPDPPVCLILDMKAVSGFDFSAINVLGRFMQTAVADGVRVVLSSPSESLQSGLERNVPADTFRQVKIEADEDRAMEKCEDFAIEAWRSDSGTADEKRASLLNRTAEDLDRFLERRALFEDLIEALAPWSETRNFEPGDKFLASEENELQILIQGRASAYDDGGARLCQCGVGDLVLPLHRVDTKAASIVADESGSVMVLGREIRQWLEERETRLAMRLYRYLLSSQHSRGVT